MNLRDEVFIHTFHWGAVYPYSAFVEPLSVNYCQVVQPQCFVPTLLTSPMLILNNDHAWTGFHVAKNPPLQTLSSLLVGRKAWIVVKAGDLQRDLCRRELSPLELALGLQQNLFHNLKVTPQEPHDTIYLPNNCAHAVLSNGGWTTLLTWQLQAASEKERKLQARACINGGNWMIL